MLDSATQLRLGTRLDQALAAAGLVIERACLEGGNVRAWEPVDGVSLLGRFTVHGWRVREAARPTDEEPDSEAPYLRLVSDVAPEADPP